MTYIRTIVACGFFAFLLASGWFTAVGLTLGATSHPVSSSAEFVANPTAKTFHDPEAHCIYLDTSKPLLHFRGQGNAEEFGEPCEHCLSQLARQPRSTLTAHRP